jgi:hypothetical protein
MRPQEPCLACRCAVIVYRNPFHNTFYQQLEQWLSCKETDINNATKDTKPPYITIGF